MKKLIAIIGSLLIIAGVVVAIVLLLPDHSENEKSLIEKADLVASEPRNDASWLECPYISQNADSTDPNFIDGKNISGSGMRNDPYKVYTAEGLAYFAYLTSQMGGYHMIGDNVYIELARDIDLADYYWVPISAKNENNQNLFYGHFNGNGYKIYGLFTQGTNDYEGLIGYASTGAVIENVTVMSGKVVSLRAAGTSLTGNTLSVGAIVGKAEGVTITNCHNHASINVEYFIPVGGIVGQANNTQINRVSNDGNISISTPVSYNITEIGFGGIVGTLSGNSKVTNSYNMADVKGRFSIGGVVGLIERDDSADAEHKQILLQNVYNTGNIEGETGSFEDKYLAGIVGVSYESVAIQTAYNSGNIYSKLVNSGIANIVLPQVGVEEQQTFSFKDVANIGNIYESDSAWGIAYIRRDSGTNGNVTFEKVYNGGKCPSNISSSNMGATFTYDENLDKNLRSTDFMSKAENWTSSQSWEAFTISTAFYPALTDTLPNTWTYHASSSLSGEGSATKPYLIQSGNDFGYLAGIMEIEPESVKGKFFKVANDIDLSSYYFSPIGSETNPFIAYFDGGNYSIRNMKIYSTSSYQAMFANIDSDGEISSLIKNVKLENVDIAGFGYTAALVAKMSNGSITSSSVSGQIISNLGIIGGIVASLENGNIELSNANITAVSSKSGYVGGIVGNMKDGQVRDCKAEGTLYAGGSYLGGIAGRYSGGLVSESFADIALHGTEYIGGVVGAIEGSATALQYCGATGSINTTAVENVGGVAGAVQTNSNIFDCFAIIDINMPTKENVSVGSLYGGQAKAYSVRSSYVEVGLYNDGNLVGKKIKNIFLAEDQNITEAFKNYFAWSEVDGYPVPKTMCNVGLQTNEVNVAELLTNKGFVVSMI